MGGPTVSQVHRLFTGNAVIKVIIALDLKWTDKYSAETQKTGGEPLRLKSVLLGHKPEMITHL